MYDDFMPYYHAATWQAVTSRLEAMTDADVKALAKTAGIDTAGPREEIVADLLVAGGFLLVHLNLIDQPKLVAGTHYMHDIHEYVLDDAAASQLAARTDVSVRHPGGDLAAVMSANEVIYDLETSDEFDQVGSSR